MPEPPALEQLDYQDVLAQYGLTMECVQRFELTLKSILFLHRSFSAASSSPITDEIIDQLMGQMERKGLGRVLNELKALLPNFNMQPFPESMDVALVSMVKVRNRLAHRYLIENSRLLRIAHGRRRLLTELRWYAQIFLVMNTRMEGWLDSLIGQLGHTRQELEEQLTGIAEIELEELKSQLQRMGLDA